MVNKGERNVKNKLKRSIVGVLRHNKKIKGLTINIKRNFN